MRPQRRRVPDSLRQRRPGAGRKPRFTSDRERSVEWRVVSWIYNRSRGSGSDRDVLDMALALVRQSAMNSLK